MLVSKNEVRGTLVNIDGEVFYKIENFDQMQDFFMTLTSSSDVWNFLWAQGGLTAGRKNSDNSIFPYSTCDKISDEKNRTGSLTIIKIIKDGRRGKIWQPFESMLSEGEARYAENIHLKRNIYKNQNGSKIWFEEINAMEGLAFRYGWTSSKKYGLIKTVHIENLSEKKVRLQVLDGAKNIMCAQSSALIQTNKSVLLDAYKKIERDEDANIALLSLSSVVTDKAEPSECLKTNVCWFTTNDSIILSNTAVKDFIQETSVPSQNSLLGKRGECYIVHDMELGAKKAECWEQVFDVNLDAVKLAELKEDIRDRQLAWKKVMDDVAETDALLTDYISQADGIQNSADENKNLHHRSNVMFNIMRGGFLPDDGKISSEDFLDFVRVRNVNVFNELNEILSKKKTFTYNELEKKLSGEENPQFMRVFLEYLPITFSRRHGDPSRPWNAFNIELTTEDGKNKLNFEGNWRDIFQNWEALVWSYPFAAKNMCAIFLNAMTVDGFNPYRISREGLDWEVPEKDNPWSQYGYWTDHQIIYFQKLFEFFYNFSQKDLHEMFKKKTFSCADIPYRIKSYAEILKDPRNSIRFDYELDKKIKTEEKEYGKDRRLVLDKDGNVKLYSLSTKVMQIVLAKALNHIPGAGIWMNVQRPEWNDANNALAGYGASVVTLCHLYRMLSFLIKVFSELKFEVTLEKVVYDCLVKTSWLYETKCVRGIADETERKKFVDEAEILFEEERTLLYKHEELPEITANGKDIACLLEKIASGVRESILFNRRKDSLFHSYNTVQFEDDKIKICNLKLMLEGQVAILSAPILNAEETKNLCNALKTSALYEKNQRSYMLYPNDVLPHFEEKNCIASEFFDSDFKALKKFVSGNQKILLRDVKGVWHFASDLRNDECLTNAVADYEKSSAVSVEEKKALHELYEKTFNHQKFTGRSGTFYGYEGLGCIYWHQVSKLLLAVQENAEKNPELWKFYDEVKAGLSYSKSPEEFGAFPTDPYSHTPYLGGAKQPGMTGQVKEEIITRWGELGVGIEKSCCKFNPELVSDDEYDSKGKFSFSWCGTKIIYRKKHEGKIVTDYSDGSSVEISGYTLPEKISKEIFYRTKKILSVTVE